MQEDCVTPTCSSLHPSPEGGGWPPERSGGGRVGEQAAYRVPTRLAALGTLPFGEGWSLLPGRAAVRLAKGARLNSPTAKDDCHAEDHAVLVVRHPGRGRGALLLFHLQEFEGRDHCALWRGRAGAKGQRHDDFIRARRPAIHRLERR